MIQNEREQIRGRERIQRGAHVLRATPQNHHDYVLSVRGAYGFRVAITAAAFHAHGVSGDLESVRLRQGGAVERWF